MQRRHSIKNSALRKTTCIWFGRIASLSACVLFADRCVIRIIFESFLDCSLQEVLLFLKWRTAFSQIPLRLQYHSSLRLCRGQLAPCTPRRAEPARPQLPAARILQPLSISPIFRQFTQLKLSIYQIKCLFFRLFHNLCKRWL